ncbi:HupE/UreJ family protein [Shimia aestuarii]|uniref:HupE / UreJ protein n=1 Tax=Shimia aestuarii TaxID=254406 RepID=A0A1I4MVK5_9RHOB|nr:HupE/UreJ family protein [Shimia aestuarii]SFM07117.1 HupE / UreJ protein [Shimia aestuarii]
MSLLRALMVCCLFVVAATGARAHALDPGYLSLRQLDARAWQVFWRKPDVQGTPMAITARLPEGCAPATGPAPVSDGQAWASGWTAICPEGMAGRMIRIEGLERQATDVLVRFEALEQSPVTFRLTPSAPEFVVPEVQTVWGVLGTYGVLGFEHILEGWDHLLFVLALVLLIRAPRRLVGAITAFTVAHSITLALAALGHLSIPGPPVEAIIALSVVFLAIEMLKRNHAHPRLSERAPWMVAFAFGLLHGLGFAGALREIGLPESDVAVALLAFNIGVETGQLVFVAVILAAMFVGGRVVNGIGLGGPAVMRLGERVAGYGIGCIATFWLAERVAGF